MKCLEENRSECSWFHGTDALVFRMDQPVTDQPPRVRVSARIPFPMFQQFEARRFALSQDAGHRVSSRSLLETAISKFLEGVL